ncbi:hypothetical protein F2Q68_00023046 [Brassica cretica]|nr:hypothetical protein F2Q68_00023046 [Brassica cretica]KAF3499647.1 hypothetical protein F2Q69_00045168 [Brassica cretica]KAF3568804.1 hypothetical protein DY000_02019425 [Brassica cretica]
MVSQSAGQTRFRTFKYENNGAVVVRAIVCFQPMANCQAEYFRHMLKPVT